MSQMNNTNKFNGPDTAMSGSSTGQTHRLLWLSRYLEELSDLYDQYETDGSLLVPNKMAVYFGTWNAIRRNDEKRGI